VRTLPIALYEKLREPETGFKKRSTVTQGSFQRLPNSNVLVSQRDNSNPHEAFADRLAISKVQAETEVEDQNYHVQHMQ